MMRLNVFSLCLAALISSTSAFAAESSGQPTATDSLASKSFQLRNKKFGDLLRPEDANSANGTRLVLYPAQLWKCMTWKFHAASESTFHLQNHFTSKTFAPTTTDPVRPVTQVPYAKENPECPAWRFIKLADGTYKISDAKSGNVLAAAKEENGSGVRVVVQAWQEKDEQKWELIPIDPKQLTM